MFAIGDSLVPCDEVGRLSIQSNILIALASFPFLQTAADLLAASLFLERLSARPLLRNIILHTGEARAHWPSVLVCGRLNSWAPHSCCCSPKSVSVCLLRPVGYSPRFA
jgi:hypothetical protein